MCYSQSHEENDETYSPLSLDFRSLEFLAIGKSGIVYAIDGERVLNEYHSEGIDTERRALARLSPHVNNVKYLRGIDKGCILERGKSLRKVIQETAANQITLDRKIRWLQEAAEGMQHIHDNGKIQADTGCQNMILVQERLKIIDFEGCSIDGEATTCCEWFSC
ncbi:hypothetical protein K458DRAFT_411186 [Lentithecium fluviatile CBS 122367]|uniref:Protein kinase domain-containing protein n=1 Tax=Lentithecium fluviatile CBS 122367 TaxID=1168545 RepID=A0A6G1JMW5_9PLEO|nr:hypothetical protein K458DRAFT_411186 [Lentithecium fluviatile CBS 122367]